MKDCVTHHHACDCREAKFAKLEADLAAAQRELAAWKQAVCEYLNLGAPSVTWGEQGHSVYNWIERRVAELLAQEGGK